MNELDFENMVFFDADQGRIFDGLDGDFDPLSNNFTDFPQAPDESPAIVLVEDDQVD
jgi:hypothetical protein